MLTFFVRRSVGAGFVLVVVSLITFAILQWLPGNPAEIILGMHASPAQVANLENQLGLNHPWYLQYWNWLTKAVHGNLGTSLVYGAPVSTLILQRLPVTLSLTGMSLLWAAFIGFPIGVIAAVKKNKWPDSVIRVGLQIFLAVPSFWMGLLLMSLFAMHFQWFPVSGLDNQGIGSFIKSLVLPSFSLGLVEVAVLGRIVRRSMIDALEAPYASTALSKGLPATKRYVRHGLRTALITPITIVGMQVSSLLGGTVVIENLFSLPGIGRLLFVAIQQKDYPLIEGLTLFIVVAVFLSSLIVDQLYRYLDPRIRLR
ncbi:ABC transporter permease [Alicyclobacillus sp. SO9]|uniref:ABC transporter permease n=1 Tax=Alicyclobacillus sp. SO9 TaxID=2665646 RepID=UPI0018E80A15|nr:ABC transporter permease [Alicyclobacillus sp. SO9]QQE78200.1 ABC transporter permease [Alicyclobacillus sp. SO9]